MTHTVLDYNGIRTAKWACVSQREIGKMEETCQAIAETLGFPVFVKPANAGSSVGVNKATDMETLREAIQIAFSHDCKVVIEEFIDGKELEVAVFGYDAPFASYVGEIQPAAEFYDYEDKPMHSRICCEKLLLRHTRHWAARACREWTSSCKRMAASF